MKKKNWQRWFSMGTTIKFLMLLSALAALGSIISQNQDPAFYEAHYGPLLAKVLMATGLANLYHSPWFLALGIWLCLMLTGCAVMRCKRPFTVQKLGSILLHVSFVIIIMGAGIGGLTGAKEDVKLAPDDSVTLKNGALAGAKVAVHDFTIHWYDNGSASQYECALAFTSKKGKEDEATISVNHPLRKKFVTIYQESYGWEVSGTIENQGKKVPFNLKEGETLDLGEDADLATMFVPNFDMASGRLKSVTAEPRHPILVAAVESGSQLSDLVYLSPGEQANLAGREIHFEKFEPYSGLRIKFDAGIPIVFLGFILSCVGLLLRYAIPKKRSHSCRK